MPLRERVRGCSLGNRDSVMELGDALAIDGRELAESVGSAYFKYVSWSRKCTIL